MVLMRYEPLSSLTQFQKEMDRLLGRVLPESDSSKVETGQWIPTVDIREEPDRFVLYADIPGVDPNKIDVSMEGNILTIKGERETEAKSETNNFTRIERIFGTFYRRFTLPDSADAEKISAQSKHGVLEVHIPKREIAKSRKIKIKSEE